MNSSRALFIGRFQPFHYGHLEALKYILNRTNQVVIVIGSAQYSHTLENPFTTGERITMISAALKESEIQKDSYYLVPVEDLNVHDIWVSYIKSRLPRFDVVYSNEALTSRLFNEAGIKIMKIPFFKRNLYSATEIRRRIIKGLPWSELTPPSVAQVIKEVEGVKRIRDLTFSDNPFKNE